MRPIASAVAQDPKDPNRRVCETMLVWGKVTRDAKFEYTKQYSLALCLKITNIFDYTVNGAIYIDDLENAGKKNKYKYRLAKFTDVC